MSTRVWRQLAQAQPQPHTAAQDSIVRLALAMMGADVRSNLTPAQRQWIIDLAGKPQALTPAQRQKLRTPLLAYLETYYPRSAAIVAQHCT